jgi:hypothetical protein
MNKFILSICFGLVFSAQVQAEQACTVNVPDFSNPYHARSNKMFEDALKLKGYTAVDSGGHLNFTWNQIGFMDGTCNDGSNFSKVTYEAFIATQDWSIRLTEARGTAQSYTERCVDGFDAVVNAIRSLKTCTDLLAD